MKIGIFDSGLGGLLITHSLIQTLPEHFYVYLGDTAHVPYGNRSQSEIYEFTRLAVNYLFQAGCSLVIIACNTASAEALRRIQQEYLPTNYPLRRVLGVLIPAAEAAVATRPHSVGVLATKSTVHSRAFNRELGKLDASLTITSVAAPKLVPLIEAGRLAEAGRALDEYLEQFPSLDTLILGCTHYPYLKDLIRTKVGSGIQVIAQDEILPAKLEAYLSRHPTLGPATVSPGAQFTITRLTPGARELAARLFGEPVKLQLVDIQHPLT